MAEESTNSFLTPETNDQDSVNIGKYSAAYSDSVNDGDSTGSAHHRASNTGCESRKSSTENFESANKKKVPHYLRVSTGSCHDFCKYGRNHEFEEKTTPLRKRIAKILPPMQKVVTEENSPGSGHSVEFKVVSPKHKPSPERTSVPLRDNASSSKKIPLAKHESLPCKKTPSPHPPEVTKREISLPSKNVEVPLQQGSSSDGEILTENKTDCLTKKCSTVHSIRVKDKMRSPSDISDTIHGKTRRNSDVTAVKRVTEIKTYAQKAKVPLSSNSLSENFHGQKISTQSRKARKLTPSSNDQNKIQRTKAKTSINNQDSWKNLHVIKKRSNAKAPSSSSNIKDVDGKTQKFVPEKNKLVKTVKAHSMTQNANQTLRKSRLNVSEDKHGSPVKLKFKSGKVVDIQSDNNGPRRLKFRRARLNTTNLGMSSIKVVLKHQDVQRKKDAQGLFNNVIEATASKLVESRKSKVKALVGAFETVISLQDSKASTHTVKLSGD